MMYYTISMNPIGLPRQPMKWKVSEWLYWIVRLQVFLFLFALM